MKRCLDVGIRLCDEQHEHYVDEIVGVSVNLAAELRDNEAQSFSKFFEEKKDTAYKRFITDLQLEFNKTKKFNHIISETPPPASSREREIMLFEHGYEGYWKTIPYHEFTEFEVKSVYVFAQLAGQIEIKIYDVINGHELHRQISKVHKGVNYVKVNQIIKSSVTTEFFIAMKPIDASLLEVKCEELKDCGCWQEDFSCDCYTDYICSDTCEVVSCKTMKYKDEKAFCIDAVVRCNFEDIVCRYAEYLIEPYKYLVGIFLLKEKLNTYVRNWFSEANVSEVKETTLPEAEMYYRELLTYAVGTIYGITKDSICWGCSQNGTALIMSSYD